MAAAGASSAADAAMHDLNLGGSTLTPKTSSRTGIYRKTGKSIPVPEALVQRSAAQLPSLHADAEAAGDLSLDLAGEQQLTSALQDASWKSVHKATEMRFEEGAKAHASPASTTAPGDQPNPLPAAEGAPVAVGAGGGGTGAKVERFDALYEVGEVLGKGTYGSVRLAKRLATGKECAVKIIDKLSADSTLEDLAREIAMLADLKHPNIIRLIAAYESQSHVYVVTELALGGELMHRITQEHSVYSEREVQRHIWTVLQAIDFMHSKGIVHRDLKPENIMLSEKGPDATIKIVDFGLSQYTQGDKSSLLQTVCGTHKYLSPEMILCDRGRLRGYSKAVDTWGVGMILYVMLFGYNPFEGQTRGETHENILKCKYTFPADANASAQVKDLISHLLVRDYTKRYTVKECMQHPWFNDLTSQASHDPLVSSKKSVREMLADFNAQRSSVYEKVKSVHRRLSSARRLSRTSIP